MIARSERGEMLSIDQERPDHPDAIALQEGSLRFSALLYPPESNHGLTAEEMIAQGVRLFVARKNGAPAGCGGYMIDASGAGEVKGMFVHEAFRGTGIGGALLSRIEQDAASRGVAIMRLETGVQSRAALALYRRFGYRERGPFAAYKHDPLSVFMEKMLA